MPAPDPWAYVAHIVLIMREVRRVLTDDGTLWLNIPRCRRGIRPGERYLRAVATPNDTDVNPTPRWSTLQICCEHMRPEQQGAVGA